MKKSAKEWVIIVVLRVVSGVAQAANLSWDVTPGDSGVITDGEGTWVVGGANWNVGAGDTNWVDGNSAILGGGTLGSVGTLTITTVVSASSVTFNAPNGGGSYTVAGGTLTLTAPAAVTNTANGLIGSIIAGSAGLTKVGAGTLTLSGVSAYTGGTILRAGTLTLSGDDRLPTTGNLYFGSSIATSPATTIGVLDFNTMPSSQTLAGLLVYVNSGSANTLMIGRGKKLTVNGPVTIGPNAASTTMLTVTGGSWAVANPGGAFQVGSAASYACSATLNMSGLDVFSLNLGATGLLRVGDNGGASTAIASTLILANTNSITAATLNVGGDSYDTGTQTLKLGSGVNILNANSINVGGAVQCRSSGSMLFNTGSGVLTIRAADGAGRTALNVASCYANTANNAITGSVNLSGHQADLLLSTLAIGQKNSSIGAVGVLTFDTGTLDVTTVELGSGSVGAGTLNIGGGRVIVGAGGIILAVSGTGTGNLNFTGGSTTMGADIAKGGLGGSGNMTINGGTLDMQGHNIGGANTINTLNFQSGTVLNVSQVNNGATLTKTTAGIMVLGGNNTYSGATLINGGTLALAADGLITNSPTLTVSAGAVFDVSAVAGGFTLWTNQILQGSGTITGGVTSLEGSRLYPGLSGAVGTLTLVNVLALSATTTNTFDFTAFGASNDRIVVGGALAVAGSRIAISLMEPSQPPTNGSYSLFSCGTFSGSFDSAVLGNSTRKLMTIDTSSPGSVNLIVSGSVASLTWNPTAAADNLWNVQDRQSWTNMALGVTSDFSSGDKVTFNDLGGVFSNGVVNITVPVSPGSVTVNATGDYIFGGAGNITGLAGLLKDGTGVLTLTAGYDFSGGVIVSNGVIRPAVNGALGAGTVQIVSGATLELTNAVTITCPLSLSGAGIGGLGALRNVSGNNTWSGTVTLISNVTTSVEAGALAVSGIISGSGSLTKAGAGTLSLSSGNTYTGKTTINTGTLKMSGNSAGLSSDVSIAADSVMEWALTGIINKTYAGHVTGSALFLNSSPSVNAHVWLVGDNSAFAGTFRTDFGRIYINASNSGSRFARMFANGGAFASQLSNGTVDMGELSGAGGMFNSPGGNTTFNIGYLNTASTFSGAISSSLNVTKVGSGTLTLSGVNTYTGATTVNEGCLLVNGRNTGASAVLVNSGGTLGGTGLVAGVTTIAGGGCLSPGDPVVNGGIGALTISNTVTLASNATFVVQLMPEGLCDRLVSFGNVTNSVARLSVLASPGSYRTGTRFTVMTAPVMTGTFLHLPDGGGLVSSGQRFNVTYPGGTNVVLEAVSSGLLLMVQ